MLNGSYETNENGISFKVDSSVGFIRNTNGVTGFVGCWSRIYYTMENMEVKYFLM